MAIDYNIMTRMCKSEGVGLYYLTYILRRKVAVLCADK